MPMLLLESNEKFVTQMQELRRLGYQSIAILHQLRASGLTYRELAANFVKAFGFGMGEHRIILSLEYGNEDVVNSLLETRFAQRRIGKSLTLKNVAKHLCVEESTLDAYLHDLEIAHRLIPSRWEDGMGRLHETILIPPDLLRELEVKFLPSDDPKLKWWAWEFDSNNV